MTRAISARWLYKPNGKILKNPVVIIEDKKIREITTQENYEHPRGIDRIEYPKGIILPGMINGHTHLPETLIRGICDDENLQIWLNDHVWKIESKMRKEHAKVGALLGIAEMFSTGTVGFIDQFYYSEKICEAVIESGIKAFLAPSIFEGNAETGTTIKAFEEGKRIIRNYHGKENRLFVGLGPHAPYSVEAEMYLKIYDVVDKYDSFIHTHLSETKSEVKNSLDKFGMTPIQRMAKVGIMDKVIAAHCVHLQQKDIEILKKNHTVVSHNPQSNLKLGSGIADIPKLLSNEIPLLIGTDGSASNNNLDIVDELRTAALLQKGSKNNPKSLPLNVLMKLATSNASTIFPKQSYTGKLQEGEPADLIVVDMDKTHLIPVIDPLSNFIYSSNGSDINLTMINGQIVYKDGTFPTLDIAQIKYEAQAATENMMNEANYSKEQIFQ